jgi:3',5'-cyclic AMP phosphodiesterase CpdA
MTRLAWTTDIHLNFLSKTQIIRWLDGIAVDKPDMLLITGDIGESKTVREYLMRMVAHLDIPIYFVLGNHDFYHDSVDNVRQMVTTLCGEHDNLRWLPLYEVVSLSDDIALVGHDSWSDGGYGDFVNSSVFLNDYLLIADLASCKLQLHDLLVKVQALGNEAGDYFRAVLPQAAQTHKQVYVALHSPPFPETTWHEGKIPEPDDPYLPHFSCKAAGDALLDIAAQYPQTQFTVLCGHTHGEGDVQVRPNLRVLTGGAEYGNPQIKRVFKI